MSSELTENRRHFANVISVLILDCGCGKGLYAEILKKRGIVVGIDINKDYLKKVAYRHKCLCSVTYLPFKSNIFDFSWACAVIEHVKEDCVPEIIRVAKRAIFLTPNKNSPFEIMKRMRDRKGSWELPGHLRLYTIGELKNMEESMGTVAGFL